MDHDFRADIDAIGSIESVPVILDVVCRVTGLGFSAVARVTDDRWVCLAVNDLISFGLRPGDELQIDTTICQEVRNNHAVTVIDHVAEDETFRNHRTPAMYGFQSYISMPIFLKDGSFFGTLCAIDPKPAQLKTPQTIGMFKLFAELIALQLDVNRRMTSNESLLLDERRTSELREQFIAVLGHDLRNPLAAIGAGTMLLKRAAVDEKTKFIVDNMQKSVTRMTGLIDNVLDFARGRLGGGLALNRVAESLEPMLVQVIEELKSTHPDPRIEAHFDLQTPVNCDPLRVGQMLSNLLGNALEHGVPQEPVRVHATSRVSMFELAVVNRGAPIPTDTIDRLFLPFSRGEGHKKQQGLGLGLYIASEIARAHGGKIDVVSTLEETKFTFRMAQG